MNRFFFFAKGMIVITLLGMLGSGIIFLFNSCTKNYDAPRATSRQEMLGRMWRETLYRTHITLPRAEDKKPQLKIDDVLYARAKADGADSSSYGINALPGISDTLPSHPGMYLFRENIDDQYTEEYILTIQNETRDIVEQSIEYIESYGFTEADFYQELGIGYDPALVVEVAMIVQVLNEEQGVDYVSADTSPFLDNFFRCAMEATGVTMLLDLYSGGMYTPVSKALIIRAVGRVAAKYISWIGIAMTMYDFASCMGWLNNFVINVNNKDIWKQQRLEQYLSLQS